MDSVREAWTDERLDDLNHRVDRGFREGREEIRDVRAEVRDLRSEMNERFATVDARFEAMDARLDGIQRSMNQLTVALASTMLAGFAAMTAVIAIWA